jgi:hypothetical protein
LGDQGVNGTITLKWVLLSKWDVRVVGWIQIAQDTFQSPSCFENRNEPSGYIRGGEYFVI